MNERTQEILEAKSKKKKFYQKWWFLVIIGILSVSIVLGIIGDEESENEYTSTDQVQGTAAQTSEEDYKLSCQNYTYEELARNPENYKGEKIALRGEVIQVLESGKNVELRVNMNNEYDQTVYILYTLKSNEGRILENDIVKIYGTFEGLITYESVFGAKITIPRIDAKYIEIIEIIE